MLEVLHADNHLLAVAKPAGVPTVPDDSGDASLLETAKAWVKREYAKPGAVFLGVVQRLDRPVSGVVCFARTSKAADRLTAAFRERATEKRYLAVARGWSAEEAGRVAHWLRKDRERNRVTWSASEARGAKWAETEWRVLARGAEATLVELRPLTGRPHQLRCAAASLGHPLLGDLKYGADAALEDRSVALHALSLAVDHPTREERVRFAAAPPDRPWWRAARAHTIVAEALAHPDG